MPQAQLPNIGDRLVKAWILQGLDGAPESSWIGRLAMRTQSEGDSELYAGLGNVPAMRRWIGPKLAKQLREYSQRITNEDWEATLELKFKDLKRDKTGQILVRIGEFSQVSIQQEQEAVSLMINGGDGTTYGNAFDGTTFFSDSHAIGDSGTIDNSITYDVTTTTAPTSTEMAAAIMAAIQAIYGFKNDQGKPTNQNERTFTVMVPTVFWSAAITAVSQARLAVDVDNPLKNIGLAIDVVQNPYLTWTTKFAVFASGGPAKAMIVQEEEKATVESLVEGSDWAFHNQSRLYSVIKAGNVGYGRFDKAVLVTLT